MAELPDYLKDPKGPFDRLRRGVDIEEWGKRAKKAEQSIEGAASSAVRGAQGIAGKVEDAVKRMISNPAPKPKAKTKAAAKKAPPSGLTSQAKKEGGPKMPMLKKKKDESKEQNAVRSEMHKMKKGTLHSGSKTGPKVTNPKQAIAIGLSEARASEKSPDTSKARKQATKDANRKKRNKGRS